MSYLYLINNIMTRHLIFFFIFSICVFLTPPVSKAQTSRFEQYNLNYGISVEIPKHWEIIDKQIMHQIDSNTESLTKIPQGDNDIIIAANYIVGDQILASLQVSVRTRNTFTQDAIRNMSQSEIEKQDIYSRKMLVDGLAQMNNTSTRVSEFKTIKEIFTDLICLNTNYQIINSSKSMNISIYVFYLGNRAVKMTLSYENSQENLLKPTIEKIKKSLAIRK